MVGNYQTAQQQISGEWNDVISDANIDLENALFFIRNEAQLTIAEQNPERSVAEKAQ